MLPPKGLPLSSQHQRDHYIRFDASVFDSCWVHDTRRWKPTLPGLPGAWSEHDLVLKTFCFELWLGSCFASFNIPQQTTSRPMALGITVDSSRSFNHPGQWRQTPIIPGRICLPGSTEEEQVIENCRWDGEYTVNEQMEEIGEYDRAGSERGEGKDEEEESKLIGWEWRFVGHSERGSFRLVSRSSLAVVYLLPPTADQMTIASGSLGRTETKAKVPMIVG